MVGDSLSTIVTLNPQVWPLPLESVALHTTKVVPFGKVEPLDGVQPTLTEPQLSVAVGAKVTLARLHRPGSVFCIRLGGHMICGTSLSFTVMAKLQLLLWPAMSFAVQVTIVVPLLKLAPDGGLQKTVPPGQLSLIVGANVTTAAHWPGSPQKSLKLAACRLVICDRQRQYSNVPAPASEP